MSKKKNLIQQGEQLFTFPNGDTYRGEYAIDMTKKEIYRNGMGTYIKLGGLVLTGKWSMDVLIGPSEITYKNKCKYDGSLTAAGPDYTAGIYTFGDGSELRGDFKKDFFESEYHVAFFDPNSKQWDHELNEDETQIILRYNWLKDEEDGLLCAEDDEDSISLPIRLSDSDSVEEEGGFAKC